MSLVFSRFGSKFIPMVSLIATITMLALSATAQDGSSSNQFERFKVSGVRPKPAEPEPPAPSNFPSLTFSPTTQTSAVKDSLADVIERCEKSVVRIEVTSDAGSSQGSGFVIDSGIIATNVHVLAGARSATAVFPDQTTCTIDQILAIDE